MSNTATLKVQKWGNSLAVRIPSSLARKAGFQAGQAVEISSQETGLLVTPTGERHLTLAQRLALFDPAEHGGEAMAVTPVGKEVL